MPVGEPFEDLLCMCKYVCSVHVYDCRRQEFSLCNKFPSYLRVQLLKPNNMDVLFVISMF